MKPTAAIASSSSPDLPEIQSELRSRLEGDILRRGIVVPILVSEDGEIIDGRVRAEIARTNGLDLPKIVVGRLAKDDRHEWRVVLNVYRRQLTRDRVRELITWELRRSPQDSDVKIAGRIGTTDKTVAGVRRKMEATSEIPRLERRTSRNGKSYPAARPLVYATRDADVKQTARVLDYLGDDAPVGHVSRRNLKGLAFKKKLEEESLRTYPSSPQDRYVIQAQTKWSIPK